VKSAKKVSVKKGEEGGGALLRRARRGITGKVKKNQTTPRGGRTVHSQSLIKALEKGIPLKAGRVGKAGYRAGARSGRVRTLNRSVEAKDAPAASNHWEIRKSARSARVVTRWQIEAGKGDISIQKHVDRIGDSAI